MKDDRQLTDLNAKLMDPQSVSESKYIKRLVPSAEKDTEVMRGAGGFTRTFRMEKFALIPVNTPPVAVAESV